MLGTSSLGSVTLGWGSVDTAVGAAADYTLIIDGQDVSSLVLQDSLELQRALDQRSTLRFTLIDSARTYHPDPGDVVYLVWDGTKIFGGKIERIKEACPKWSGGPLYLKIDATDWTKLLDRFFIAYGQEGMTLSWWVHRLIDIETPLADDEGITISSSIPTFTYQKVNFHYRKVSECIRDLCQLAGLDWTITPEKELQIYDRATFDAPWTIGDSGSSAYRNLQHDRSIDQYRNVQWIRGGKDKTTQRVEYFRGDNTTVEPSKRKRTFNLAFPVASITSIVRITGAVYTDQRFGIKQIDKDGDLTIPLWKHWFYEIESNEITQNMADDEVNNATLTADEQLQVTYYGYFPMVLYERNDAGVNARIAAEGGSGIYEAYEEDSNLDTLDLAKEKSKRLLEQYGRVPATLTYQVDSPDLVPGHLQSIVLADHAINAQYMIDEVSISFPAPNLCRADIRALDGERQEGWLEFWQKSLTAGRKFVVRENEVIYRIVRPLETVTVSDNLNDSVNDIVTIPAITEDPYTVALVGVTIAGHPLARIGKSNIGVPIAV